MQLKPRLPTPIPGFAVLAAGVWVSIGLLAARLLSHNPHAGLVFARSSFWRAALSPLPSAIAGALLLYGLFVLLLLVLRLPSEVRPGGPAQSEIG